MARKAEIFIGIINEGTTIGSGATAISDQFITNSSGMVILNQRAQTGAVIADITSITKLAGPYAPIISVPANIMAGTITFLKIGIDIRDGQNINWGDILSLVGNVAGVIASMAILAGAAPGLIAAASLFSIGAGLHSIKDSETFKKLTTEAADFFKNKPSTNYSDYVCAPDMRIVHKDTLRAVYNNQMFSCNWSPETGDLWPSSIISPNSEGGAWGGRGRILSAVITSTDSSPHRKRWDHYHWPT